MTSSLCMKFAHFLVVLVRKCMVQKFLISYRFDFLDRFFLRFFDDTVRAFFIVFVQKMFLHSDLLKLCLKKKRQINEFFPDTTVFYD